MNYCLRNKFQSVHLLAHGNQKQPVAPEMPKISSDESYHEVHHVQALKQHFLWYHRTVYNACNQHEK
jgi:hypothetical protein